MDGVDGRDGWREGDMDGWMVGVKGREEGEVLKDERMEGGREVGRGAMEGKDTVHLRFCFASPFRLRNSILSRRRGARES